MAMSSLTTRIDADLKAELERIARFEERSTSYMATQAIRNLVAERQATRRLVQLGLEMVEAGAPGMAEEDVEAWLLAEEEQPFPAPRDDA